MTHEVSQNHADGAVSGGCAEVGPDLVRHLDSSHPISALLSCAEGRASIPSAPIAALRPIRGLYTRKRCTTGASACPFVGRWSCEASRIDERRLIGGLGATVRLRERSLSRGSDPGQVG